MLFIACEPNPPYVVQLYEPSGMMKSLGKNKWDTAKFIWKQCMDENHWLGYFEGVGRLDPLPYQMNFEQSIETSDK